MRPFRSNMPPVPPPPPPLPPHPPPQPPPAYSFPNNAALDFSQQLQQHQQQQQDYHPSINQTRRQTPPPQPLVQYPGMNGHWVNSASTGRSSSSVPLQFMNADDDPFDQPQPTFPPPPPLPHQDQYYQQNQQQLQQHHQQQQIQPYHSPQDNMNPSNSILPPLPSFMQQQQQQQQQDPQHQPAWQASQSNNNHHSYAYPTTVVPLWPSQTQQQQQQQQQQQHQQTLPQQPPPQHQPQTNNLQFLQTPSSSYHLTNQSYLSTPSSYSHYSIDTNANPFHQANVRNDNNPNVSWLPQQQQQPRLDTEEPQPPETAVDVLNPDAATNSKKKKKKPKGKKKKEANPEHQSNEHGAVSLVTASAKPDSTQPNKGMIQSRTFASSPKTDPRSHQNGSSKPEPAVTDSKSVPVVTKEAAALKLKLKLKQALLNKRLMLQRQIALKQQTPVPKSDSLETPHDKDNSPENQTLKKRKFELEAQLAQARSKRSRLEQEQQHHSKEEQEEKGKESRPVQEAPKIPAMQQMNRQQLLRRKRMAEFNNSMINLKHMVSKQEILLRAQAKNLATTNNSLSSSRTKLETLTLELQTTTNAARVLTIKAKTLAEMEEKQSAELQEAQWELDLLTQTREKGLEKDDK